MAQVELVARLQVLDLEAPFPDSPRLLKHPLQKKMMIVSNVVWSPPALQLVRMLSVVPHPRDRAIIHPTVMELD